MQKIDFCLILTATINPGNMPDLIRKDIIMRLDDYKKSFEFWLNNSNIKKIIFIENSNSDLSFFHELAKKHKDKEIEILSNNLNSDFDKSLGKGYGQYLCLREVFKNSKLVKNVNYFIDYMIENVDHFMENEESKNLENSFYFIGMKYGA